ncbi:MAG TPA: tyrosine-type recombinase/integrase [Clostridia bacterium]|nr:tyrosine-type recombinase/integrase [Clostridia bacterium]
MKMINQNNFSENNQVETYRDHSITNDEKLISLFLRNLNSKNTKRSYQKAIEDFREFIPKNLNEITVGDILDFSESLNDKAKTTKHNRLSALTSLYSFGVKLGYLRYNPFAVINKPKIKDNGNTDKFLSKEEISSIWDQLRNKPRNAVIGAMLITLGLRVSELCNIKCKHLFKDFEGNVGVHIVEAKGDKSRDVKIRSDVLSLIKTYRKSIGKKFEIPDINNDDYLLVTRTNNRVAENYIRYIIDDATKKAGIDKKISPHWYRHSSASISIQNGCDLAKVTESFGWSTLQIAKRYLHNLDKLKDTSADYVDVSLD